MKGLKGKGLGHNGPSWMMDFKGIGLEKECDDSNSVKSEVEQCQNA